MKTIKLTLNAYKTTDAYLKALKKAADVSSWAEDIIKKVPIGEKREVEVALLTFADLGLSGTKTTQEIKDAAIAKGYGLPDAEMALALVLKEQEKGDWWITLHSPIADSVGDPSVLRSRRGGGGHWVGAGWGGPGGQWRGVVGAFAFSVLASTGDSGAGTLHSDSQDVRTSATYSEQLREVRRVSDDSC